MLRGLEFGRLVDDHALVQGDDQMPHVAVPAKLSEAVLGVAEGACDPAQRHLSVPPALDVAGVVGDRAIEVLDRVRGAQRAAQRQRERCLARADGAADADAQWAALGFHERNSLEC